MLSASLAGTFASGTTPTPSQFVPVMGLIEFPQGTLIAKSAKRPSEAGCAPPLVVSPTTVTRFRACRSFARPSAAENVSAEVNDRRARRKSLFRRAPEAGLDLRPVHSTGTPGRSRRKQRRDLAHEKSARKSRKTPESHRSDRTQTVPNNEERGT